MCIRHIRGIRVLFHCLEMISASAPPAGGRRRSRARRPAPRTRPCCCCAAPPAPAGKSRPSPPRHRPSPRPSANRPAPRSSPPRRPRPRSLAFFREKVAVAGWYTPIVSNAVPVPVAGDGQVAGAAEVKAQSGGPAVRLLRSRNCPRRKTRPSALHQHPSPGHRQIPGLPEAEHDLGVAGRVGVAQEEAPPAVDADGVDARPRPSRR